MICEDCGTIAQPLDWRCTRCGGVLDLETLPAFVASQIRMDDTTLWRYRDWLGMEQRVTLGEGMTPLIHTTVSGTSILAKLEMMNPTGSYKDRGTVTMLNYFAQFPEVSEVIDDSSGNAGASIAAYASALGIRSRIFVPTAASPAKKALIQAFGAQLEEIPGEQSRKTEACHAAAATTTYASHAWSPYFLLGQITAGFEIWEQTIGNPPDIIVVPVGHGALFCGIARAMKLIYQARLIHALPRMIAVQSEKMDPVVKAYEAGAEDAEVAQETGRTIADGIMVDKPVRSKEILRIIRETGGAAIRVSDDAIRAAQEAITKRGIIAEPTSAATIAALPQIVKKSDPVPVIVCCITGNALKYVGR
jgi:threonine synthase